MTILFEVISFCFWIKFEVELDSVNNSFIFNLNNPINRIKIEENFLKLYFETLRMNTDSTEIWQYFHYRFNYAYKYDEEIADLFIKIGV